MLRFIKRIFNRKDLPSKPSDIHEFLQTLGIRTDNTDLYEQALTHGSFVKKQVLSNERLEFIGDSVLGASISDILYRFFPTKNEGRLSKMRAKLVSREALNELGTQLGIPDYLRHRIGKSEFNSSNNYIGNALEALVGAIYLDKGYDYTYNFVKTKIITPFADLIELDNEIRDYKSHVIIWAQKHKKSFEFLVKRQFAPDEELDDENERFLAKLIIDGEEISQGKGRNKKTAQQKASKVAIDLLNITD